MPEALSTLLAGREVLVELLAVHARAGALGDDRREVVRLGRRLEHHLAADGEADAADAVRVDVGTLLQVGDRGLDVAVAAPAEGVRVPVAAALAAAVEEQHAVAVRGQHPGLLLRAVAAGEGDDGGAVARRDVPALELQPVARGEAHVLVGDAEAVGRHDGARGVGEDLGGADGHDERHQADEPGDDEQRAAAVAPHGMPAVAARRPERRRRRRRRGAAPRAPRAGS